MLGSTEFVNQAIVLIMFLDNVVASLTLLYLFSLWILDLTVLFLFCFCFLYYFNEVLTYFNKCNLFIAICTYLSTIDNPSGISLLFKPIFGVLTVTLLPKKMEPWFALWSFCLQMLLCISMNLSYDLACIFLMSGQVHRFVSPSLAASLEPLVHHLNAASLCLFCMYYFGRYSSELDEVVRLPYSHEKSTC